MTVEVTEALIQREDYAAALAAAFRAGAAQMRERCATLAEDWSVAQGIEASDAPDIATAIRTLPVEEPRG